MTALEVLGVGLLGPGLADWTQGAARLRDPAAWQAAPTAAAAPQSLPATERRRAGTLVRASIAVAEQACAAAAIDPATLATVFTSATGDAANCHALCEALAAPQRLVSPTRFTNSVHNAPAGYWHIATHATPPSTSLCAFDASFAAALLEAAVTCRATTAPVLLVAADTPYPEPLHALRPVSDVFAVALVLAPARGGGTLSVDVTDTRPPTCLDHAGLEAVRTGIPAARALPLLQALARQASATLVLDGVPGLSLVLDLHGS